MKVLVKKLVKNQRTLNMSNHKVAYPVTDTLSEVRFWLYQELRGLDIDFRLDCVTKVKGYINSLYGVADIVFENNRPVAIIGLKPWKVKQFGNGENTSEIFHLSENFGIGPGNIFFFKADKDLLRRWIQNNQIDCIQSK